MHRYFMYLCRVYMLLSTWKSIMPRVVLGSLSFCKTRSCRDATRQILHTIPTHDHPLVRVGAHSLAARNFQIFAQQKECLSLCWFLTWLRISKLPRNTITNGRYAPAPDEEALDYAYVVSAYDGRFYAKVNWARVFSIAFAFTNRATHTTCRCVGRTLE